MERIAQLLGDAVHARVTPAATVEVGCAGRVLWQHATGHLTYAPDAPLCTLDTIFDLASLTKVMSTASLAMRVAEADATWCDTRIAELDSRWTGADRADVTVRQLLDHSSGLPAHVRLYEHTAGRDAYFTTIAATPLAYAPGTESQYSDLGFMLLGLLLEQRLGATLDVAFASSASHVDGPLLFTPPVDMRAEIAPTEVDPWRGRTVQGEVHDENCAALGGVAGHAGLFGTVRAVGSFAQSVLQTLAHDSWLARRTTMQQFVTRSQVPGSSRALAWDTMLPTSSCGTRMSPRAIGHTGFTGTSLWIDPEQDVYVALLTNRVHPTRDGDGIQPLRRAVSDAAVDARRSIVS
jgi:CubicO group peptidase (beta-lactamase class C family)